MAKSVFSFAVQIQLTVALTFFGRTNSETTVFLVLTGIQWFLGSGFRNILHLNGRMAANVIVSSASLSGGQEFSEDI